MSPENSSSDEQVVLSDEEQLDIYEERAAGILTPETEQLIKAAQWLVSARLVLQNPEADRFCLRLHRGLEGSQKHQTLLAQRLDILSQFPEDIRGEIIAEQFNIIRGLLPNKS
jgi:hypothetical protein